MENCHGSSVSVAAVSLGKQDDYESKVSEANPNNLVILVRTLISPLEETDQNTGEMNQEEAKATFASRYKNVGKKLNAGCGSKDHEASMRHAVPSEPNVRFQASDHGSSNAGNCKPACSSPAFAGSTDLSAVGTKIKESKHSSDQVIDVAKVNDQESNRVFSIPQNAGGNDTSKKKKSFGSGVSSLAEMGGKETGNSKQHSTPAAAGISSPVSDGKVLHGRSEGTSVRKSRRSSGRAASKENAKGNSLKEKSTNASLTPSGISKPVITQEMQLYGNVNSSASRLSGAPLGTSSVPDLNASAFPSLPFHQPFTLLQKVQLYGQIFVSGSLIKGITPDEAYMMAAFGGTDGGKSIWEKTWSESMERLQRQKSHFIDPKTPHSGARLSDQTNKPRSSKNKATSSSLGLASSGTSLSIMNPTILLSSPLWSTPTPSTDALKTCGMPHGAVLDSKQPILPILPNQTPPPRNFAPNNYFWMIQAPSPGPWAVSLQTSGSESNVSVTKIPVTEPVQLINVKEPHLSGTKPIPSAVAPQNAGSGNLVTVIHPPADSKKITASSVQQLESKPREIKKNPLSDDPGQSSAHLRDFPTGNNHPSISVDLTSPSGLVFGTPSVDHSRKLIQKKEQKANLSEEIVNSVQEASLHAEDAASVAAAAIAHCEEIWSQLDKQRTSGLVPDVEARLASAAAAIAAAASVAKAAAAAANVASNAALQAKLLAQEAISSNGSVSFVQSIGNSPSGDINLEKATSSSSLNSKCGTPSSNPVIDAAKEAAKRRVEAAAAASKQAENMYSIIEAAEMAAEAVSQAAKVVAIGDPLALKKLVEAGSEGYWKISDLLPSELVAASNDGRKQLVANTAGQASIVSEKHSKEGNCGSKDAQAHMPVGSSASREIVCHASEEDVTGVIRASKIKSSGREGKKVSHVTETTGVVPESDTARRSSLAIQKDYKNTGHLLMENSIKEGSHVEVLRCRDGSKAAWYQANILNLQDGKAFVCYTELKSDEGSDYLKEWVPITGEDEGPKVRVARPIVPTQIEGRRRRSRAAMGDFKWSVGDLVDAWIQDCWCEGVVAGKSKNDDTAYTIQFPAQNQTSVVKAWHLRPSLIWRDRKWIECSRAESRSSSHETDSPQHKRIKTEGKEKIQENTHGLESEKPEDIRLLDLVPNIRTFNVGKSSRNEDKPQTLKSIETTLQKEESRVMSGVPKPGKKRKYMEVNKYYVTNQGVKNSEANELAKQRAESKPKIAKPGLVERPSVEGAAEGFASFSSVAIPSDAPSRKPSSSNKIERANEGKLAPVGRKLAKAEGVEGFSNDNSEAKVISIEPRRSNRQIQPTSKFLEGLQISLSMSRIPSISQGHKSQKKNASEGSSRG